MNGALQRKGLRNWNGWSCATSRRPRPRSSGGTRRRSARRGPDRGHPDRGVLLPGRGAHREGRHASPTRSACCSGTTRPSSRRATAAASCGSSYHLGRRLKEMYATRSDPKDRPIQQPHVGLSDGRAATTSRTPRRCCTRSTARRSPTGSRLPASPRLKDDGSTACGCWIYAGVLQGRRQPDRRGASRGSEQNWVAPEWGWAWPLNRRILYNRASADPEGKPVVRAQEVRLVGRGEGRSGPA